MDVQFGTTWLTGGDAQSASQVRVNSNQILDEATFFRAAYQTFFGRGNVPTTLRFVTNWIFNTVQQAEQFVVTLPSLLPYGVQAACTVYCGDGSVACQMQNAVLESANVVEYRGLSVAVEYSIRGGFFATNASPVIPPGPASGTLSGDPILYKSNSTSLSSGAYKGIAIAFGATFPSIPVVIGSGGCVSGNDRIEIEVNTDSITTSGFTVDAAAPMPDGTYTFNWMAILAA